MNNESGPVHSTYRLAHDPIKTMVFGMREKDFQSSREMQSHSIKMAANWCTNAHIRVESIRFFRILVKRMRIKQMNGMNELSDVHEFCFFFKYFLYARKFVIMCKSMVIRRSTPSWQLKIGSIVITMFFASKLVFHTIPNWICTRIFNVG